MKLKLILVMVTSLDGKSTQKSTGNKIHSWTSIEDQKYFEKVIESASLLIMGSKTYESAKGGMLHKEGKLRVIITHNPTMYENEKIPGQLEFSNETPTKLIERLESEGYSQGYLLGGARTNTSFFKTELINELWQTLEPKILGLGNGLVGEEELEASLQLISCEKLNEKGTLLLKYSVLN